MKRINLVRQHDSMDCGPTCLKMIAEYYGKNIPLQYLREKSSVGKNGVSLFGISEAAEQIGFRTQALRLEAHILKEQIRLPAILHWNYDHFVVLYKIRGSFYYLADPAAGFQKYSIEKFISYWYSTDMNFKNMGIILLLEPTNEFNVDVEDLFNRAEVPAKVNLFSYLRPYRNLIIQLFLGLFVGAILQIFVPFLTQSIVDIGISSSNLNFVFLVLIGQIILLIGRLVIELIRGWILLFISARINVSILNDFLIKLMNLPISFFDTKHTGDILQRMSDHGRIESFLTGSSLNVLFSLISVSVLSLVLVTYNIYVFFIFCFSVLVYSLWVLFFLKKSRELDFKKFSIVSKEQSLKIQIVQGMQEIKLNGVDRILRSKWEVLQSRILKINVKNLVIKQWQQIGAFFINEGKNIFIIYFCAKLVIEGNMSLGSLIAIQYVLGQLNSPIDQIVNFAQNYQSAQISMDRINEIHSLENEDTSGFNYYSNFPLNLRNDFNTQPDNLTINYSNNLEQNLKSTDHKTYYDAASISFQNVNYSYSGSDNEYVLKNINLTIPRGKITAIVGVSGSGKSTLLKLLLKFYKPSFGKICIGNLELKQISSKVWRQYCGVVMQESYLFSDTIAKNISLGDENPDYERLQRSIQMANLEEFIDSLPLGLDTMIGYEGVGLSMGQKQRILIARVIYKDPEYILLDEATNSLDSINEYKIVKAITTYFSGKTVVVVAHRLSTIRNADQIIVLKNGNIVETGTHEELINLQGEYFNLVKYQLDII